MAFGCIIFYSARPNHRDNSTPTPFRKSASTTTATFLSFSADIGELDGGKVATVTFPNPNDLTLFNVSISPDTGYWAGAIYHFVFTIPAHYPHSPPKVECKTKIYHPNIDLQGKVCLNILREDWRPVLDINSVIYGLIYLFYEPNPDDPLNHEAAELFRKDVNQFERLVKRTLRGGLLDGVYFERLV
jgi:ubiquitin-conjugating enzyme E2 M